MTRRQIVLLAAAVAVGLAVRLYFYTGLIASDDLTHGYAAHHLFIDPNEGLIEQGGADAYSVNGRRIAVNIPLWMSIRAFGVHEWSLALVPLLFSLAGIFAIFVLIRMLASTRSGIVAAWLWACLPVDAYSATVILQDNIFATLLAVTLCFLVASEVREHRRMLWAFCGGAVLGYMQYTKGSVFLTLAPLGAWAAFHTWRNKRIDMRIAYVVAGFVAVQVIAGIYFWWIVGDLLHFWRLQFSRMAVLALDYKESHPFPANVTMLLRYMTDQWVFGYTVVLFPILVGATLLDRRTPARLLLALILAFQLAVLLKALTLGNWTQRYTLQASVPFIVFTVLGARALLHRLDDWLQRRGDWPHGERLATATAVLGVILSLTAMGTDRQQHSRSRAQVVHDAFVYLDNTVRDDEVIYTDMSNEVPYYTKRALWLLNGYRPFKGGFRPITDAYTATSGWVILSHLEDRHRKLRKRQGYAGLAPNWLEVFRSEDRGGKYYARVFRVMPSAEAARVKVIHKFAYPAVPPDLSDVPMQPLALDQAPDMYKSARWLKGMSDVTVSRIDGGLDCAMIATPDRGKHHGGVVLDVAGMRALRFDLELVDASSITGFFVYAYGANKGQTARWRWSLSSAQRKQGFRGEIALVPGRPTGYFRALDTAVSGDDITKVHLFAKLAPGARAGFRVRDIEVSQTGAASLEPPAPEPIPDISQLTLEPVALSDDPKTYQTRQWRRGVEQVDVRRTDSGLRVDVRATGDDNDRHYAGIQLPVDGMRALRFDLELIEALHISTVFIYAYDKAGKRSMRWRWRLTNPQRHRGFSGPIILVPGQNSGDLRLAEAYGSRDGASGSPADETGLRADEIGLVYVFIKIRAGVTAGFQLSDMQYARP